MNSQSLDSRHPVPGLARAFLRTVAVFAGLGLSLPGQTMSGLDTTTFVVMGEGLAAGMGNFGLSSEGQKYSFPAQVAAQMNTAFAQPLIQPPGIGDIVGYPGQEVRLQTYPQGSVRQMYQTDPKTAAAPPLFVMNTSIPGLTLSDSLALRPVSPIAQKNMKQTVINLILGFPQLFLDNVPLWSQFEYAKALFPSVALIELGYYEVLDAAATGDLSRLPDPATFASRYGTIVDGLRGLQAQVIVTTIPNPLDTAYFSTPATAAAINATVPSAIIGVYNVSPQDYVTRPGLTNIASQIANFAIAPLPEGSILSAAKAAAITAAVNDLNTRITAAAQKSGAVVYDLNGFLHSVRLAGASTGSATITADYLGGFYSYDGAYPSPTGNALIANDVLRFLNTTYKKSFSPVNVAAVAATDMTVQAKRAGAVLRSADSSGVNASGESAQ